MVYALCGFAWLDMALYGGVAWLYLGVCMLGMALFQGMHAWHGFIC